MTDQFTERLNASFEKYLNENKFVFPLMAAMPSGIPATVRRGLWGPCCVETGWTVAEITTGLLIGRRLSDGTLPIVK